MLLPIFAPLVTPFLAIFPRALQLIPAFVPVLLKIIAALLTLLAPFVPGFTAIVDPVAPLAVAVLRALIPVRSLLGSGPGLSGARPIGGKLARTITKRGAESGPSANSRGCAKEVDRPLGRQLGWLVARSRRGVSAGGLCADGRFF
jgi:hypothetical protein